MSEEKCLYLENDIIWTPQCSFQVEYLHSRRFHLRPVGNTSYDLLNSCTNFQFPGNFFYLMTFPVNTNAENTYV